jgi:poly-gamma-glutamate synthesis protein (capsule biosynthesis protein)
VDPDYVWGETLAEFAPTAPNVQIINLETAVTDRGDPWPNKGIHYRVHPANVALLEAAGIDCCVLSNNHVLDWGYVGLRDTLKSLENAGIRYAGAGRSHRDAKAPAVFSLDHQTRVLVFAFGSVASGIPRTWMAGPNRPGVSLIRDFSHRSVEAIAAQVRKHRRSRDLVVVSMHWGGNWGYSIPTEQRRFAHSLIDTGLVDVLHGHSSHHPKGIEVYRGKPILYGCGDFLNDYEGIRSHHEYRGDLSLMYLPTLHAGTGELIAMKLVPMQIRKFRMQRAEAEDTRWLQGILNREGEGLGTSVERTPDGRFELGWG